MATGSKQTYIKISWYRYNDVVNTYNDKEYLGILDMPVQVSGDSKYRANLNVLNYP